MPKDPETIIAPSVHTARIGAAYRGPAHKAPVADEPEEAPLPVKPALPSLGANARDPQCAQAGKHVPMCRCTDAMRAPIPKAVGKAVRPPIVKPNLPKIVLKKRR